MRLGLGIGRLGKGNSNNNPLLRFYQWVSRGILDEIYQGEDDNWYFRNYGIGGSAVNVQVLNTQVATFDGTAYLSFVDLNGATIVSSGGTSTPTKISDQRIYFTAGTCWSLTLSNGSVIPLIEGQGSTCYDRKGVHNATITSATLSAFWANTSPYAMPAMLVYGGSQYLVCKSAGTTTCLVMPDGSNVGSELITTGSWTTGTGWSETTLLFACDGSQVAATQIKKAILTLSEYNYIVITPVSYSAGQLTVYTGSGNSKAVDISTGKVNEIMLTTTDTDFILEGDADFVGSFYVSVKEVQTIDIHSVYNFKLNLIQTGTFSEGITMYLINSSTGKYPSAQSTYWFNVLRDGKIEFWRGNLGTVLKLRTTSVGYIDPTKTYEYRISFGYDGVVLCEIYGNAFTEWTVIEWTNEDQIKDTNYTTTKFVVYNSANANIELSHFKRSTLVCGCIIGDSTIAEYAGGTDVGVLLAKNANYVNNNIAVPGDTINEQLADWSTLTNKSNYDWVIIQIGLNDLNPAESADTAIARLQNLVDTINADNTSCDIIMSCMLLCHERLIDVYGAVDGETSYQKLLDMNEAIMGNGANAITGVEYRNDYHVRLLSDDNGDLLSAYDAGDHVHPNTAGKAIIATGFANSLYALGIVNISTTTNRFDPYKFIDQSGTFGVQNVINIE